MMDIILPFLLVAFVIGCVCGALVMGLIAKSKMASQAELINTFKALAADSLNQNNDAFLHLAESRLKQSEQAAAATLAQKTTAFDELVKPMKESLLRVDTQLQAMEVKREGAYRELAEMVSASRETQTQLRNETSQLLQALRAPTGRGRWGELQLQRILEMTGMSIHAHDFDTQVTVAGEDNNIRPDVIVNLPGNRCVIIDSKVPLMAYLDAAQSNDEATRQEAIKQHAKQLRAHIRTLGGKAYWEQIPGTPELVVLFLPGEHFLSAALDSDPELMEYSAAQKVVLATPMTLIALLRTVAYGWRQESLRENVRQIADLGGKLYGALLLFAKQMEQVGSRLGGTIETYNKTVGALERNVLGAARKLIDYGAASGEDALPVIEPIERQPRIMTTVKSDDNA